MKAMVYKVGVTTGLHYIARSEELATTIKKLGYGLTRGTIAIEIASDVPHEITETDGKEIRRMAEKQGVDVLLHGSLTIPMCIPERSDWRDAHDHMQKSIRSAVHAGAKYVDFHACLNIWLELMTYTSRKLTMSFCDHEGHFISEILRECEPLRKWFVEERGHLYANDILTREEITEMNSEINNKEDKWYKEKIQEKLSKISGMTTEIIDRILQTNVVPDLTPRPVPGMTPEEYRELLNKAKETERKANDVLDEIKRNRIKENARIQRQTVNKTLLNKLARGKKWDSEELRAVVGILDGYHIMAHYMFYKKDKLWVEVAKMYEKELKDYKMDYNNPGWLKEAWDRAEKHNDRGFKEFFYGVVGAKFLEGHMKRLFEWIENDFIPKELKGKKELIEIAKNLKIGIESPDARDAQHAGLHLLWRPKQIYAAIKVIRETLDNGRIWMLADFEHVATQGLDPVKDMDEMINIAPDFGKYCISVHANAPNPMHAHEPLELGDIRVYKLLYYLWKTGFGRDREVYVIYERGGGEDPFKHSVDALKLMVKFMEKGTDPDKLPLEFFGIKGPTAGDIRRQSQIIQDHAYEPLKDLLEISDEEWGILSSTAVKKGKRLEVWKKGELR